MTAWPATLRSAPSVATQRPLDVVWLAVLGAAARGEATMARIRGVFADGDWSPSYWLLTEAIDEMVRGGHLRPDRQGGDVAYGITAHGRETLCLLLSVPSAPIDTPIGRLEEGLKRAVTGSGRLSLI